MEDEKIYLMYGIGSINDREELNRFHDEVTEGMSEEDLESFNIFINCACIDLTDTYLVTVPKSFMESNYPCLLGSVYNIAQGNKAPGLSTIPTGYGFIEEETFLRGSRRIDAETLRARMRIASGLDEFIGTSDKHYTSSPEFLWRIQVIRDFLFEFKQINCILINYIPDFGYQITWFNPHSRIIAQPDIRLFIVLVPPENIYRLYVDSMKFDFRTDHDFIVAFDLFLEKVMSQDSTPSREFYALCNGDNLGTILTSDENKRKIVTVTYKDRGEVGTALIGGVRSLGAYTIELIPVCYSKPKL